MKPAAVKADCAPRAPRASSYRPKNVEPLPDSDAIRAPFRIRIPRMRRT